jgi:transposase
MGQRLVACDREQSLLMPPDVREWLPERHLAWFVIDAVEEMDLGPFYAACRVDGRSRPRYDPAMMVALLLYAYARGLRSWRVIERACGEDVAFWSAGRAAAPGSRDAGRPTRTTHGWSS